MRKKSLDRDKCTGCRNCELACIAAHSGGDNIYATFADGVNNVNRSRNKVEMGPNRKPFPQFCRHCDEPACVEACMSGALSKNDEGTVICDTDVCVGCYMCVMSCPYGMAKPAITGERKMVKCDLCSDRESMACVDACPTKCLKDVTGDGDAFQIVE